MLDIAAKPSRCESCGRRLAAITDPHVCLTLEERRDRILAERAHELPLAEDDPDRWDQRRDLA